MKIVSLESWPVFMNLSEPYTIAYETVEKVTNVFLRIETDSGFTGYGCAAPEQNITGETPDSVLKSLNDTVARAIKGSDPLRPIMLIERIKPILKGQPAALAAVDMALYDIQAKKSGMPLWKLLGGFREQIQTSITIGILPEKVTVERAVYWKEQGFRCLKIKGGLDVDDDIDRIHKVREAVGEKIEIRFLIHHHHAFLVTFIF